MVEIGTNGGGERSICNILKQEFGEYLKGMMDRTYGRDTDTPMGVSKEVAVFIYLKGGEWKRTDEVEGDSYSISGEKIKEIEDLVPEEREKMYLIHSHPSEVTGLSPHDVFAFTNLIDEYDGTFVIEEGDNIHISGIEKTDQSVERGTIIEHLGNEWALLNALENEINKFETGIISPNEAQENMNDILEPFVEQCSTILEN